MEEFDGCFAGLDDPRDDNARHALNELLMIALCAVLCGAEDCSDMALFGRAKEGFLRQLLRLRHGIPSHDTFSRVFRLLDPQQFHDSFLRFMRRFAETVEGVVAIDGKTLRHSFDRASGQSPLHLVSAWAAEQRLVLGQLAVDGKSNEITAVPKLLAMLSLKGTIVTADALNCQRGIAEQVLAQGGDSGDVAWLSQHDWPGLAAIGKLTRSRQSAGKTTTETAYYLLSAPFTAERFGAVGPPPLGHREQPALGARRHHERGPHPQPKRQQRPTKRRSAAMPGTQPRQARTHQGLDERQAQTRRMGRRLPGPSPPPLRQSSNAIALTVKECFFPTRQIICARPSG